MLSAFEKYIYIYYIWRYLLSMGLMSLLFINCILVMYANRDLAISRSICSFFSQSGPHPVLSGLTVEPTLNRRHRRVLLNIGNTRHRKLASIEITLKPLAHKEAIAWREKFLRSCLTEDAIHTILSLIKGTSIGAMLGSLLCSVYSPRIGHRSHGWVECFASYAPIIFSGS